MGSEFFQTVNNCVLSFHDIPLECSDSSWKNFVDEACQIVVQTMWTPLLLKAHQSEVGDNSWRYYRRRMRKMRNKIAFDTKYVDGHGQTFAWITLCSERLGRL